MDMRLFNMYQSPTYTRPVSKYRASNFGAHTEVDSWSGQPFDSIYVGISGLSERFGPRVAIAISNATYLVDYLEYEFGNQDVPVPSSVICDSIIAELERYRSTYLEKIIAVAFPKELHDRIHDLSSRLWTELDCVPLALDKHRRSRQQTDQGNVATFQGWNEKSLDEQADSMMRKCISLFGAANIPHLNINVHGLVEVDCAFHMHLASAEDFEKTVTANTWSLAQHYATDLKNRGVKIAIFGATPQGQTIVNTRRSLLRFSHCLGADVKWYVPDPAPKVSRIIGKMQSMLQGISAPNEQITTDDELQLLNWVYKNAKSHWLCYHGPLLPAQEGGADIVIIDDIFLSALALLSKQHDPRRAVIFHSRIDLDVDPNESAGHAKIKVFDFLWRSLQHINIIACQAPSTLKSPLIPRNKVGYMLATVDKFDALNKDMKELDLAFYGRQFNASCVTSGTTPINYPDDEYILVEMSHNPSFQQALAVLEAYQEFRNLMETSSSKPRLPKLIFCGRQPNGHANEEIYSFLASYITLNMNNLVDSICIKQVTPLYQIWNTLLSKAGAVILLPDTEGFEEKFLEAVQKGKPVIRPDTLGRYRSIVENEKNVFTVESMNPNSVAHQLVGIWMNGQGQQQMKFTTPNDKWDQVTTVGNAVNWLYLASELSKGENIEPNGEYIYNLAQRGIKK